MTSAPARRSFGYSPVVEDAAFAGLRLTPVARGAGLDVHPMEVEGLDLCARGLGPRGYLLRENGAVAPLTRTSQHDEDFFVRHRTFLLPGNHCLAFSH